MVAKTDPNAAIAYPAHLTRDRTLVKQLENQFVAFIKIACEDDHRTRGRQIGYPYNVTMTTMVHYRGLRFSFAALLGSLVEQPTQAMPYAGALWRRIVQSLFLPMIRVLTSGR